MNYFICYYNANGVVTIDQDESFDKEFEGLGCNFHLDGFNYPEDYGLWIWEGNIIYPDAFGANGEYLDADPEFKGYFRRLDKEELESFINGNFKLSEYEEVSEDELIYDFTDDSPDALRSLQAN
jgi:hypothetical protein